MTERSVIDRMIDRAMVAGGFILVVLILIIAAVLGSVFD